MTNRSYNSINATTAMVFFLNWHHARTSAATAVAIAAAAITPLPYRCCNRRHCHRHAFFELISCDDYKNSLGELN